MAVEKKEKKVETVDFQKEVLQIVLKGTEPGYISNAFGIIPKSDIAYDHFQVDPESKKKKKKEAKHLEVEIQSKLVRDPKGRVCVLARNIMDALVDAKSISEDHGGTMITKKFLRNVLRVEGVEHKDYCVIGFDKKDFRSRLDNVVQINAQGIRKTTIAFRPEFRNWEIRFNVVYLPNSISQKSVINILSYFSQFVGLGAWTPSKSGNFGLCSMNIVPHKTKETVKYANVDSKLIQDGFKQFLKEEGANGANDLIEKFKPVISKAA